MRFVLLIFVCFTISTAQNDSLSLLKGRITQMEKEITTLKTILEYMIDGEDLQHYAQQVRPHLNEIKFQRAMLDSLRKLQFTIPIENSPVLGPDNAPLTIVEFSDFSCPHCYTFSQELQKLLEKYPNKIRVIFKHFPLKPESQTIEAHRASLAAHELGKFWEYRFLIPLKYDQLDYDILLQAADMIGLKKRAFKKSFNSVSDQQIEKDLQLAEILGVNGTPTIFINGRYYERFSFENVVSDFNLVTDKADSSCNCELDE